MHEKEIWNKFRKYGDVGATPTRKKLFKRFKEIELPENAKILDVGCGSGTLARFWKEKEYDVTGLNISDRALDIISRKDVHCVRGDVTKRLLFEDAIFNLTLMILREKGVILK